MLGPRDAEKLEEEVVDESEEDLEEDDESSFDAWRNYEYGIPTW